MERPSYQRKRTDDKIKRLLHKISRELGDSIEPISIPELNSFERKLIHRHFDHDPGVVTKTYRDGDDYELRIYPVGNLKKYAEEKAEEAIQTGKKVVLPHMGNYERFVIHSTLKENDAVKSESYGEGKDRHIEIEAAMFGRSLKKIIKKIKLL
jgi:predicted RNA-binding protein Jag